MKNETNIFLSVVIPAYNEERRILPTLDSIFKYLIKQDYSFEVIVVNDGSQDATFKTVQKLQACYKQLFIIDSKINKGKGYAVNLGMRAARGELAVFTDADNSTKINEIESVIDLFHQGFEVIIGSRRMPGAVIIKRQPFSREFIGKAFSLLVRVLFGLPYIDTQAGFKAFSKRARDLVFSKQTIFGWVFDVELLVIARQNNLNVAEFPIHWENDKESRVKIKSAFRILRELATIKYNQVRLYYKHTLQS